MRTDTLLHLMRVKIKNKNYFSCILIIFIKNFSFCSTISITTYMLSRTIPKQSFAGFESILIWIIWGWFVCICLNSHTRTKENDTSNHAGDDPNTQFFQTILDLSFFFIKRCISFPSIFVTHL